jgi:hypothetical protein
MKFIKNLGSALINAFFTICILCFLAGLSAVPVALALKFIIWLF